MALQIVDLSQEIYQGMSVFPMHQPTFIMTNMTHEENKRQTGSKKLGFSARNLLISEHGGTHTDAVWEYAPEGPTIDKMPLEYFWGSAICADLSAVPPSRSMEPRDLELAVKNSGQQLRRGDIFLMYTAHYDRNFDTERWQTVYSGLSYAGAKWLAEHGVVNIGVDAPSIDHPRDLDFSGHLVCGEYGITNTENLCNLHLLVGRRFLFFGLPLKIRGGSGSPIRAVALLES
ncbi:MAG: cyclase family protein [Bacillota bacterium]